MTPRESIKLIDSDKYLSIAVEAGRQAGNLLLDYSSKQREIRFKGEAELVTDADTASEQLIVQVITDHFPNHAILAEEGSGNDAESDFNWLIDPLDGTTNYAHGFPVYCVSIALQYQRRTVLGVVLNPVLDELFTASAGEGAYLNGEKIKVSGQHELKLSLLATGFPYDKADSERDNIGYFAAFTKRVRGIRRAGSAAMDLVYVACGRLDGFWEIKLKPWDIAAGALIVAEAGGQATELSGKDPDIFVGDIVASNGLIHRDILSVIEEVDRESGILSGD